MRIAFIESKEICLTHQGLIEMSEIGRTINFNRPKAYQMRRDELRIKKAKLSYDQARNEECESYFRSVGLFVEHALAKKGTTERDPEEATNKFIVEIGFDTMRKTLFMQRAIKRT